MALENVERVLTAAGLIRENVDVAHWDEVNEVYAAFFGLYRPARVIMPSLELHHGALVEIGAIAETEE